MPILRVEVLIGSTALPDTTVNRALVFTMSPMARSGANPGVGDLVAGLNPIAEYPVDLNRPFAAGALSVTSSSPVHFDSAWLYRNAELVSQVSDFITRGFLKVTTDADPTTPLTAVNIAAYG